MNSRVKAVFSKIKFLLNLRPKILKSNLHYSKFIPSPYKTVCLISADFELAWAYRYSRSVDFSNDAATANGLQSRENVPKILKLCDAYEIPITWATVGHLFLEECNRTNDLAHPEIKRLPYFENKFWKFSSGDWFDDDPCTDYMTHPAWYCPDLIEQIIKSPVGHEIGCHTFSHIDCRDQVCSDEVFLSEINACKQAAAKYNIELKSFVHPGHQIGNLQNLFDEGFSSFRTEYGDSLAYPVKHRSGLWELKNSAIIDYRKGWTEKYHVWRYKKIIKRAIKHKKVCVLWFHPSFDPVVVAGILPEIFKFLHLNRDRIWVTTHASYIKWLNQQNVNG